MSPKASRILCFLLAIALLLNAGSGVLEAVTFTSDSNGQSQPSTCSPGSSGKSTKTTTSNEKALLYSLDLPQSEKQRLAESIKLLQLTGLQATLAMNKLRALDGKTLPDNEILAHLVYAEAALEAVEKSAKKLKSNMDIIRLGGMPNPNLREEVLCLLQPFFSTPALADEDDGDSGADNDDSGISFSSEPATDDPAEDSDTSGESEGDSGEASDGFEGGWSTEASDAQGEDETDTEDSFGELQDSWSTEDSYSSEQVMTDEVTTDPVTDAENYDTSDVATIRPGGGVFDSCMQTIYSAAHTIGNTASKLKKEISSGVSALAGAVGNVHTTIGNVVGQKNWANIMAGTKFVAATAGTIVGLVVAAPAVATTAGAAGLMLATGVSLTGAGVSLAKDLQEIETGEADSTVSELDSALGTVGQAMSMVGLAGGDNIVVDFIGTFGGSIVGSTSAEKMSNEQLETFLDSPENEGALKQNGALPTFQKPEPQRDEGGGGGGCGG